MPKEELIDEKLVDDVVEEIMTELKSKKSEHQSPHQDTNMIKMQLDNLQKSFDDYESRIEQQVSDKFHDLSRDTMAQITRLENQINTMKTAIILLSDEVKRIRDKRL